MISARLAQQLYQSFSAQGHGGLDFRRSSISTARTPDHDCNRTPRAGRRTQPRRPPHLNRPAGLNAVTLEMVRLLHQQLSAWRRSADSCRGTACQWRKAFCAGGDIRSLYDSFQRGDTEHETFFEEEYALDQYIHAYPKPLLALMDGFVLGGGMGLVQGASLRVVTERVRMGMPEVGIGYFPDVGGSYFLSRLPGELGTYMGVTGLQIRAADALHVGLADWCVSHDQIAELDRCLDRMSWSVHPQEALRTLVATLGTNRLPGSELKALHQAIDEHFAKQDVASVRASLAAETVPNSATGPPRPSRCSTAAHPWRCASPWRCCGAAACRWPTASPWSCIWTVNGSPRATSWKRARADHRQGQVTALESADAGRGHAGARPGVLRRLQGHHRQDTPQRHGLNLFAAQQQEETAQCMTSNSAKTNA